MRTTLDVEEDVLMAAKELARQRGQSTGKVLSDLARQTLTRVDLYETRNGVPLLPLRPDGGIVTPDMVDRLREELGI